jgi:4'-phosphopantetheinyl transferase
VYNEFGKPSLPNLPVHFSISHCKDAVACAVSDHNIGIDVESIVPYTPDVARKVCTAGEFKMLEQSSNKDVEFIKLWTAKEAISKYEGMGLSLPFARIDTSKYNLLTQLIANDKCALSICSDYAINHQNIKSFFDSFCL